MCHKDGWVVFKNSELLAGCLGKVTMGSESKTGLMYALIRDNSVEMEELNGRFFREERRDDDDISISSLFFLSSSTGESSRRLYS